MAQLRILVEGIDGSGKSTLVKELKNRLGWDAYSLGHRPGSQYQRYRRAYRYTENVVYERGHLSELVYSRLFGRPEPFSEKELHLLNELVAERIIVVWASPNLATAARRISVREHVFQTVTAKDVAPMQRLYQEMMSGLPTNTTLLTYHSRDFNELESIVKRIRELVAK